ATSTCRNRRGSMPLLDTECRAILPPLSTHSAGRGMAENGSFTLSTREKEDAMSTTTTAKPKKPKVPGKPPELKIGPFQGGIGVAVWLNEVQTERGPKTIRSISIAPRRYRD